MDIKVDAEFQALIPPLSDDEYRQLEANIVQDGCREPVTVWRGILLDGHNRKKICEEHDLEYYETAVDLPDRNAATRWIIENQFGRRNLTSMQRCELALKLKPIIKVEAKKREMAGTHSDPRTNWSEGQTREVIALMAGVGEGTITRVEYLLTKADSETLDKLRHGDISISAEYTRLNSRLQFQGPHVSHNTGSNEWYTPADIIERARRVMGSIDLDPASSAEANEVVKAAQYFSVEDDGLEQDWAGNVWMNPPYAQPLIQQFCDKLIESLDSGDITSAIVLVNNATETQWAQVLLATAFAVCFPLSRVKFWHPSKVSTPLQGQMIVYFGRRKTSFCNVFRDFGAVYYAG